MRDDIDRKPKSDPNETAEKKQLRSRFFMRTKIDLMPVVAVVLLTVFGAIMVYSASYYFAKINNETPASYFWSQLLFGIAGIALMIFISYIRPAKFMFGWWIALVIALILIVLVKIPSVGVTKNGASRWIKIFGRTVQVAEPIKFCMILFVAGFYASFGVQTWKRWLPLALIVFIVCLGLALLSNNASTAIIIFLTFYFILATCHRNSKWFYAAFAVGLVLGFLLLLILLKVKAYDPEESFRITRLRAWLQPEDPVLVQKAGYQPLQARYAIASGGLFGKGFGNSLLKYKLPEPINDYILAIVFEELGVFGVLILTLLYFFLLYSVFRVYQDVRSNDRFAKGLVLGVFFHLTLQILLNYGMTLGLLPTMGVTLSFLSYGGTSLVFTLLEIGLVLSVARQNKERALYDSARRKEQEEDPVYREFVEEEMMRRKLRAGKRKESTHE